MAAFSLISGRCVNDNKTMKEIDNQLSTPEQSGEMPSHPVTFVSNDEPSPMPWPNTWYPVTPIGPETEYPCPCSEGDSGTGSTDNNSVDFSIEFGRFPKWPELSGGRLMLNLNMMDAGLCWGTAFQYEHISQRRLEVTESAHASISRPEEPEDVSRAVVKTEKGFPRYYSFASPNVSGAEALGGTQMFQDRMRRVVVDGVSYLEEVQESGMTMRFRPNSSVFDHIVTPLGVKITFAELAAELQVVRQDAYDEPNMTVEAFNALSLFRLKQVWNKTDGLLDLSNVQNIKWYAPADVAERSNDGTYTVRDGAVPIKTWKLSWTFSDTETLVARAVDEENPEVTQMMLKTLRIEEPGGFISEWRAGLYPDDLTLVKGEGEDAISIVTRCRPANGHENMIAKDVNGQSMVAGGYYTDKKEKFKYVYSGVAGTENAVLCSAEKEVYQRRLYGDVLVSRTEGYETPLERTWTYGYGSDPSSPNYGKRIRETRPDGAVVEMEYDSNGNVIQRTEPWYGDIQKKISYTYSSEKFNDRRVIREVANLSNGEKTVQMYSISNVYSNSGETTSKTTSQTGCGQTRPTNSASTEWYVNHPSCIYAQGRIKKKKEIDGTEIHYEYALCSDYQSLWKCTETLQGEHGIVSGKSTRTVHYYAENGNEIATDYLVHVLGNFVSVDFKQMTYDESHRVIRTDYANGLYSSAEWSCAGPLWETDIRGLQTRYTYNGVKRLVSMERDAAVPVESWNGDEMTAACPDTVTNFTHDGAGRILSVTTSMGSHINNVVNEYDILGRIVSRTDELGRLTSYSYSSDGLTTTETTFTGSTLSTRLFPSGLVAEESGTGQEGRYYAYEVDEYVGIRKNAHLDPDCRVRVESTVEDGGGRFRMVEKATISPEAGHSISTRNLTLYNEKGQVVHWTGDDSVNYAYGYDELGNLRLSRKVGSTEDVTLPGDRLFETYFHLLSVVPFGVPQEAAQMIFKVSSETLPRQDASDLTEDTYELVSRKNTSLVSLTLHKDVYGRWSWEKTYNENGNIRILRGRNGCDEEEETVILNGDIVRKKETDGTMTKYKRTYGSSGNTLTIQDARGKNMVIEYDLVGREIQRTDQNGEITVTTYDAVTGLPSCVTTPDGKKKYYEYDFRNRLIRQYGSAVQPMKWEYDDRDHVVALYTYRSPDGILDTVPESGGDVTRWNYDHVSGFLLDKTYADGTRTSYIFDEWERLVTRRQSRGVESVYRYDEVIGKLVSITHSDGTPSVSITYDERDRIATIQDASGSRSMEYSGFEDVASETSHWLVDSTLSYSRDSLGRPSGYALSLDGTAVQQVALSYDTLDRLSVVSLNGKSFTYGYDINTGWLNELAYPNEMIRKTEFHANLPLVSSLAYVKGVSSEPLLKHAYTWDNMQRPSIREDYVGSSTLSRRHTYGYNARGELAEDMMSPGGSFSYTYDNLGNRVAAVRRGASSSYDSNQLSLYENAAHSDVIFTPTYDTDGNQTSVKTSTGVWAVQYNADNRPVVFTQGSKKVECVYDYLGRRVEKVEYDGNALTKRTRFMYMGYLMVASVDGTQSIPNMPLLGTWFWDPFEPMATRVLAMCTHNADKSVATTRYVTHDLLKSVSALFDSSGTRQAKFEYTSYGETLTVEGAWASTMLFRYSCEYLDEDLGLIYYNYRHYNPQDGRWISRDPIEEFGGIHLYNFSRNNPSYFYDILGLEFNAQTIYDNGKIRIDCETYGDKSGKGNLHIHYNDTKYIWHTKKNNFISKDGKILKLKRITQRGDAEEILGKLKKGFDKVNSTGGFSPKYGGGISAGGFLLAFTVVIGIQQATAGMQEYVDAVVNSNPTEKEKAINKVVENIPSSFLTPTALKGLIYDKLNDPKTQRDIKRYLKKKPVRRTISISDACCCKYKNYA